MIKKYCVILAIVVTAWVFFYHPKANWQGQAAPDNPFQVSNDLPASWLYKDFIITPRAKYQIKAVVLSKHHYWGWFTEDALSSYDLALGWGAMSDARNINRLYIFQAFRWYFYRWSHTPPIDPSEMVSHSSNHHIIAANQDVLEVVENFKRYDVIELEGYLVDVQSNKGNWKWHTSLSRFDSGNGACKVYWVTRAFSL